MNPFRVPLFETDPRRLDSAEVDAFARRTGWIDDTAVISRETTVVEVQPLSWWEGVELIIARDPAWQARQGFENSAGAWLRDQHLHRLDGKSSPIHRINAKTRPALSDHNVLSYLSFFCYFVHGEEGPFAVFESVDHPILPRIASEDVLALNSRPAQLLRKDEHGYHCEALVWYSDAIFLANFLIRENGTVEMVEEEQLASGLGSSIQFKLQFRQ